MTREEAIERMKTMRWEHATNPCPDRTAFDMAISALENKVKWIPVKTRPLTEEEKEYYAEHRADYFDSIFDCHLPEDGQEVLITTKYGTVDKVTFYNEGDDGSYFECYEDEGEVLAWQPLPKLYKAESEDNE